MEGGDGLVGRFAFVEFLCQMRNGLKLCPASLYGNILDFDIWCTLGISIFFEAALMVGAATSGTTGAFRWRLDWRTGPVASEAARLAGFSLAGLGAFGSSAALAGAGLTGSLAADGLTGSFAGSLAAAGCGFGASFFGSSAILGAALIGSAGFSTGFSVGFASPLFKTRLGVPSPGKDCGAAAAGFCGVDTVAGFEAAADGAAVKVGFAGESNLAGSGTAGFAEKDDEKADGATASGLAAGTFG